VTPVTWLALASLLYLVGVVLWTTCVVTKPKDRHPSRLNTTVGTTAVVVGCCGGAAVGGFGYFMGDANPEYYSTHMGWIVGVISTVAVPLYLAMRQTNMHPKHRRGQHH